MAQALAFINPRLTTENVGDLFIEDSVKRILVFDRDRSIDVDPRLPVSAEAIERINRCEVALIVGTNLWYRDLLRPGRWTLTLKELGAIRIPIVPFGVGTSRRFDEDDAFGAETRDILRAIHASCALGSARDPRTAEALAGAGIANVAMTGCPTLFRSLEPTWRLRDRTGLKRVTVTTRDGHRGNARTLLGAVRKLGLDPVIAAQKPRDRIRSGLPLLGGPAAPSVFQFELKPYLELVEQTVGAVGWRLHGNMLHLAHGNPAVFFGNNSRVQSFCEGFGLPCVAAADGDRLEPSLIATHAERLLDPATFAALPGRYATARSELLRFLAANRLEHRLATPTRT